MFGRKKRQAERRPEFQATVTASMPSSEYVPPDDKRTNICPNCGEGLAKVPGAKTKCPHCGRYIYVRTDPRINARVCVGESDLEDLEDAVAKANGTWDERQRVKKQRVLTESKLAKKLGSKPSDADIRWSVSNQDFLSAAQSQNVEGMRSTSGDMAEQLVHEEKYRDAIAMVARVIVIDWVDDKWVLPTWGGIVDSAIKSGVSVEDARGLFFEGCSAVKVVHRYAVDPSRAWDATLKQLNEGP